VPAQPYLRPAFDGKGPQIAASMAVVARILVASI